MTNTEGIEAQNAEMRALLLQADQVIGALVNALTHATLVMRDTAVALREISPDTAAAAEAAVAGWQNFVDEANAARTQAARINAIGSNARN